MRLPQIQITKTDIQMDWKITDSVQRIQQPQAELKISQPAATLEINTTNPKMDIDMSQFWKDVGLKPTKDLIAEYAQMGRQEMLKGISRRVSEGRQLMLGAGKDQGAQTIKSIAMQNHGPKRPGPYNIKFIPSYNSIKVNITPGTTDINIQRNDPEIDVKVNKPIFDYTPGDVTGTMTVRPSVDIEVVE